MQGAEEGTVCPSLPLQSLKRQSPRMGFNSPAQVTCPPPGGTGTEWRMGSSRDGPLVFGTRRQVHGFPDHDGEEVVPPKEVEVVLEVGVDSGQTPHLFIHSFSVC